MENQIKLIKIIIEFFFHWKNAQEIRKLCTDCRAPVSTDFRSPSVCESAVRASAMYITETEASIVVVTLTIHSWLELIKQRGVEGKR